MDLEKITIKKFHEGLVKKDFSAFEAAQYFFGRIEEDKEIGAYLRTTKDLALSQANEVDVKLAKGEDPGILAGVPLAIKDNILVENEPATAASEILKNYRASYDATVIRKLAAQNAIFLGKTNLDEFAMGSSTENSAFKITKNPHDKNRVPGGSSGGSAAAVASGGCVAALGSDTGGSIRLPASFCGTVGLKPTYGAVSRYGLMAMASSLDQIGPIAKTVEDAEILFDAIKGRDPLDSTSVEAGAEGQKLEIEDLKNMTIGLPKEYFGEGIDDYVKKEVESAIGRLKSLGIKFKEISLPHTKYALSCYYIIMFAEASANLSRFDGIRYSRINGFVPETLDCVYFNQRGNGFGEEVKRRIILGTFVLSSGYYDAYYSKAQKARRLIKDDFSRVFNAADEGVDAILTPVSPTPAFKIGEKKDDPMKMYLSDIFTTTANLSGLPAISIPTKKRQAASDKRQEELPVGFQLIGKRFGEKEILGLGKYYENME